MGNIFNTFSYKKEHINVKKNTKIRKGNITSKNEKSKFKDYFPEILYCPISLTRSSKVYFFLVGACVRISER
jgi:hypothetical protein